MGSTTSHIRLQSYGSTSIGRKRLKNEDSFLRDDDMRLYAVADGVGGQPAGEVASAVAIRSVVDFFKTHGPASIDRSTPTMRLALRAASDAVFERSHSDIACRGMATTLTLCWIIDHTAVFGHVGDSQGFLLHGGRLKQITQDHTVANELVGRGIHDHHPAMNTVFAHMLTQSVGPELPRNPQVCEVALKRGDLILLCSDGVTRQTYVSEITRVLLNAASPERAVEELIQLADERGGLDNATAVMVKIL